MRPLTLAGRLVLLALVASLAGCASVTYHLAGHNAREHRTAQTLSLGENLLALETPARLPVPGGFWLGLASENPDIVSVETIDDSRGASTCRLKTRAVGTAIVHYVNRFTLPRDPATPIPLAELRASSLGSFSVTVLPPATHGRP